MIIFPSADAALNLLGLSTQMPGRWIYLSDEPSRQYEKEGRSLVFKQATLKNVGFKYRESRLVAQALKALGKEHLNPAVIDSIRKQLELKHCDRLLRDTRAVTVWIYKVIKQTCREDD